MAKTNPAPNLEIFRFVEWRVLVMHRVIHTISSLIGQCEWRHRASSS